MAEHKTHAPAHGHDAQAKAHDAHGKEAHGHGGHGGHEGGHHHAPRVYPERVLKTWRAGGKVHVITLKQENGGNFPNRHVRREYVLSGGLFRRERRVESISYIQGSFVASGMYAPFYEHPIELPEDV